MNASTPDRQNATFTGSAVNAVFDFPLTKIGDAELKIDLIQEVRNSLLFAFLIAHRDAGLRLVHLDFDFPFEVVRLLVVFDRGFRLAEAQRVIADSSMPLAN